MKQHVNLLKVKKMNYYNTLCDIFFWEKGGGRGGGWGVGGYFYHLCLYIKFKSNIHKNNVITLHYTGNKLLQFGLEWNKYNNKSLNYATLNYAVYYATLQNTQLIIY